MYASVSIANVSKVFPAPLPVAAPAAPGRARTSGAPATPAVPPDTVAAGPSVAGTAPASAAVPAPLDDARSRADTFAASDSAGSLGTRRSRRRRVPGRNKARGRRAVVPAGLEALRGITVDIRPGEFLSVLGPSGCGKTTLLRIVGGLAAPTSGVVRIAGQSAPEAQRGKRIGCVFQEPALLPWRTVLDNVRLPLAVNRAVPRAGAAPPEELLHLVRLADFAGYYPGQLSRGMQQRVSLARALALDPALLLMDEPFASLDEITREQMRYELLRIWEAARKTVLFVTHSITDAVLLSDRVAVLSARPGRLRAVLPIELERPRVAGVEQSTGFAAAYRRVHDLVMAEAA